MSTLHRIREFALATVLATGALTASNTQASQAHGASDAKIADLGSMTVSTQRVTSVADLGGIIVAARRSVDIRVADLGGVTVTAPRIGKVAVAGSQSAVAEPPSSFALSHSWD